MNILISALLLSLSINGTSMSSIHSSAGVQSTTARQDNPCIELSSRNWTASRQLKNTTTTYIEVSGEIDLPSPGYTIDVIRGHVKRNYLTVQSLELVLTPPAGMVSQVVTTVPVQYILRSDANIDRIRINCLGNELGYIEVS